MVKKNFVNLIKYFLVTSIIFIYAMFILNNKIYAEETTLYLDGLSYGNKKTLVTDSNGTYSAAPLNRNISLHSDILYNQTNVFCINKGRSFRGTLNCYDQIFFRIKDGKAYYSIDGNGLKEYSYTELKNDYNAGDSLRDFEADIQVWGNDFINLLSVDNVNKFAYVLSEVGKLPVDTSKENPLNSSYRNEYQGAIWSLQMTGDVFSYSESDKGKSNMPINVYGYATDKIVADATAYSKFIKLVKDGEISQQVSIDASNANLNTNRIIGPISFSNYSPTTSLISKRHKTDINNYNVNYQGVYGQITEMKIGGQTITISGSGSQVYTDANCTSQVTEYIPNTSIYIKLTETQYNNIKSNQTVNITVTVNNQYRQGYFWVLRCNGKSEYTYLTKEIDYYWKETALKSDENYCPSNQTHKIQYVTRGATCHICGKLTKLPEDGTTIYRRRCSLCNKETLTLTQNEPCTCGSTGFLYKQTETNYSSYICKCTDYKIGTDFLYCHSCNKYYEIPDRNLKATVDNNKDNILDNDIFSFEIDNNAVKTAEHFCSINSETGSDATGDIEKHAMVVESLKKSDSYCPKGHSITINNNEDKIKTINESTTINGSRDAIVNIGWNANAAYVQNPGYFIVPEVYGYCSHCGYTYYSSNGLLVEGTKKQIDGVWGVSIRDIISYDQILSCTGDKSYVFLKEINPFVTKYYKLYNMLPEDWNLQNQHIPSLYIGSDFHGTGANLKISYIAKDKEVQTKLQDGINVDTNIQNQIVGGGSSSSGTAEATIKVQTVIDKLEIFKENAATRSRMDVPLTLKITGASKAKIEGEEITANNGIITANNVSTETGGIQIENIVLATGKNSITLEISEPNIAGYLQWSAPLVLDVTKTTSGLTVEKVSGPDFLTLGNNNINYKGHGYEYYTGNKIISGNTAKITVTNIPLINVEGVVYLDGQAGVKDVQVPNGIKDNSEPGIEGIKVCLKDENNEIIAETITDANGNYSFTGILAQPYTIGYEYNGMKYEKSINQDPIEWRNESFNSTFRIFTVDVSKRAKNESNEILTNDWTKIKASTSIKSNNIDLKNGQITVSHSYGLLERSADLALGVKVDSITVSTNGKTSTEKFGTSNAQKNVDLPENRIIDYHKALAEIDYNFTMEDYENVWGLEEENFTEGAKFNQTTMDITYLIEIKNVCARDAYVNKIKIKENEHLLKAKRDANVEYYYSNNNVPNSFVATKDNEDSFNIGEFGNISAGNSLYLKITYTDIPREYIQINNTFELEAEIMSYSTSGVKFSNSWTTAPNMVDIDSTPGNWDESEDDYGKAVVKLTTNETAERKIDGIVFDDKKTESSAEGYKFGNGNFDNGEDKLNGIVVQLIEIKDFLGVPCEYLWQETVTGSNVVKRINNEGTEIIVETYDEEIGKGQYLFKDILPGTYIVRFRYGEEYADSYVNVAPGNAVSKDTYNGINYKSTTDEHYDEEWYNNLNYTNGAFPSVARDIEAKRLELMSQTVVASKANEVTDKGMVAQTSKIDIAQSTDNLEKIQKQTDEIISYESEARTPVAFDNVNFGLELRPQTEIDLEKHITGLSIVHEGRSVLLTYTEGQESPNLKAMDFSTAESRGRFVFETDTELLQGADLKINYTYTIKNNSDKDYLNKELIDIYKDSSVDYSNYLQVLADEINNGMDSEYTIGKYIGKHYYTGEVDTNQVAEVVLKVEEMVDYLDNGFEYSKKSTDAEFEIINTQNKLAWIKANPNATDGTEVRYKAEQGHSKFGIQSKYPTKILGIGESTTKTATINKIEKISSTGNLDFIGHNAEITDYSIPSGRISNSQGINNINYAFTEDDSNEDARPKEADETMSEDLVITKNTGTIEQQNNTIQIIIISATVIAIITAGVIVVKKFVIK